jgi:hypothetical protein
MIGKTETPAGVERGMIDSVAIGHIWLGAMTVVPVQSFAISRCNHRAELRSELSQRCAIATLNFSRSFSTVWDIFAAKLRNSA